MADLVISTRTIFTTLLLVLGVWFLYQINEIILLFFVALLLSFALLPLIEKLERKKVPRLWACLLTYATALSLFILVLSFGIPPMVEQTSLFVAQLPKLVEAVLKNPSLAPVSRQFVEESARQLAAASGSILTITLGVFGSFLGLITVLVFSFYFSLEYEKLRTRLLGFFPDGVQKKIEVSLTEVEEKIGAWVRGEFILMLVIAVFTYFGLLILHVNYALPLSLIAGILEIVPLIGPIVSAVPAVLVGFATSNVLGLGVLALFVLIQQFENNIIVPRVMERAVGFDPLLTMGAILVGGKLFGLSGAFLAVPVTTVIIILLKHFYYRKA